MTRGHADTAKCIPLICKLVSHLRYRITDRSSVTWCWLEFGLYGPKEHVGTDKTVVKFLQQFL
jgi:hypothetical protein